MSVKEIAFELEDLQIKAEKVDGLQLALWQAIYQGNITPEAYEWAFMALGDLTSELKNELRTIGNKVLEKSRTEKGK